MTCNITTAPMFQPLRYHRAPRKPQGLLIKHTRCCTYRAQPLERHLELFKHGVTSILEVYPTENDHACAFGIPITQGHLKYFLGLFMNLLYTTSTTNMVVSIVINKTEDLIANGRTCPNICFQPLQVVSALPMYVYCTRLRAISSTLWKPCK